MKKLIGLNGGPVKVTFKKYNYYLVSRYKPSPDPKSFIVVVELCKHINSTVPSKIYEVGVPIEDLIDNGDRKDPAYYIESYVIYDIVKPLIEAFTEKQESFKRELAGAEILTELNFNNEDNN